MSLKNIKPLRYHSTPILPTVFGDELSFLEGMSKTNFKLNEVVEEVNEVTEAVMQLQDELDVIESQVDDAVEIAQTAKDVANETATTVSQLTTKVNALETQVENISDRVDSINDLYTTLSSHQPKRLWARGSSEGEIGEETFVLPDSYQYTYNTRFTICWTDGVNDTIHQHTASFSCSPDSTVGTGTVIVSNEIYARQIKVVKSGDNMTLVVGDCEDDREKCLPTALFAEYVDIIA